MNYIVREAYEDAKNNTQKLSAAMQRMGVLCELSAGDILVNHVYKDAEKAYAAAMKLSNNMLQIMNLKSEACTEKAAEVYEEETGFIALGAEFHEETGSVSCSFFAPPLTKNRWAKTPYLDLMCRQLPQKINEILPENFTKMKAANVIYVHHFHCSSDGKQPYFDNDNLAIKGVLDMVIPLLCVDDAYVFCDNFYVAQPDEMDYAELIVMPKGQLLAWANSRPELEFTKELGVI